MLLAKQKIIVVRLGETRYSKVLWSVNGKDWTSKPADLLSYRKRKAQDKSTLQWHFNRIDDKDLD